MPEYSHHLCPDCKNNATHKLAPCGHGLCYLHWLASSPLNFHCGICGHAVADFVQLPNRNSDINNFRIPRACTEESAEGVQGNGSQQNGNGGDESSRRSSAMSSSMTPAPGAQHGGNIGLNPRYVPPHMRDGLPLPVRPESSESHASFASQIPMNSYILAGGHDGYGHPARANFGAPHGSYAYGPTQLTREMDRYDPFVDTPRRAPQQQQAPMMIYNGGMPPNFGNPMMRNNGTMPPNFGNSNGMGNVVGGNPMNRISPASSANDSAVADSKAHHLARLIRSGAMDDPNDIDYGNPGPSRRGPAPAPVTINASMYPIRRGKVAAGAGQGTAANPYGPGYINVDGNSAAFLGIGNISLPSWFGQLQNGYQPTVQEVFESLPFIEACRVPKPSTGGVIRIRDIPYQCSRSEIIAFLGRNAQILSQPPGTPYHAIHIVIHRQSGKTMDAFVELENAKEANWIVSQIKRRVQQGRGAKIGDRSVKVEFSSQGELMSEMFPCAKNVTWEGPVPRIDQEHEQFYEGVYSTGFQGFLADEEITHLVKHAETPQRRCLVRAFENIISTLHKYPWFAVEHVNLHERLMLCNCALHSIRALMMMLRKAPESKLVDATKPTQSTLQELVVAALTCPGFSETEKATIILNLNQGGYGSLAIPRGLNLRFGGNHQFSNNWPFKVLVKQPGAPDAMVEYVAKLFRDATADTQQYSLADLHSMRASGTERSQFGDLKIKYALANTVADAGKVELRTIEEVLCRVLPRSRAASITDSATGFGHQS